MAFKDKHTIEYARTLLRRMRDTPMYTYLVVVDEGHVPRMSRVDNNDPKVLEAERLRADRVVGRFKWTADLTAEALTEEIDFIDSYVPKWARVPPGQRKPA